MAVNKKGQGMLFSPILKSKCPPIVEDPSMKTDDGNKKPQLKFANWFSSFFRTSRTHRKWIPIKQRVAVYVNGTSNTRGAVCVTAVTSWRGAALPSQNSGADGQRVIQAAAADGRDGNTLRPLSELFTKLLRFIYGRHVGTGDGVCGAAGGAVAGGADGSREGRARRAGLLQLQQTGACDEDWLHHSNKIKSNLVV